MCERGAKATLCPAYGRKVTSSRLQTPRHTTGAHRAQRRAPHASPKRTAARSEAYLDGLFTYCLSVLCDHDGAVEALGAVLAIAERQEGRCPRGEEERKTWLYALARWTCLRKLAQQKQKQKQNRGRQAHRRQAAEQRGGTTAATEGARSHTRMPPAATALATDSMNASETAAAAEAHRRELAQLAWPEAAGTTPEQREALELAVRHRLAPRAVASVLGLDPATARELLAAAACEVERTRAALAVVETGNCPTVARLFGDHRVLLSAALRSELVRHVDDCPRCRRAAERAGAEGPWPGVSVSPGAALPVVEAPRPSAYVAMVHAQRNRSATPRFDRTGFPMDPKDHAARRDRLRARVVTTTLVATVVAAPVIALWSAYRGAPLTGEGHDGSSVTATETDDRSEFDGDPYDRYQNAGNASPDPGSRFKDGSRTPDVSAEVISSGAGHGPGRIAVTARSSGGTTLITLTASGGAPVAWSARADAPWLRLSRYSGTLAAGESVTIRGYVDHVREPAGAWSARVRLAPSGSTVLIRGHGATPAPSGGPTQPSPPSHPSVPSNPPPTSPDPTDPTHPTDPTSPPTDPDPTDPDPTDPTPSPDPSNPSTPADPSSPSGPSGPSDPGTSPSDPAPTG
ncbi:hypothetical protein [Streptomyces sp. NPDC005181]|uniref:BACON domain-containing protein n=1 Tax=Streptomyces sp. NPDC005181 TaxID=3156869 RepID=UPI0033BC1C75